MSANKLTPLEVLQKQKIRLQTKSEALADVLEENFDYLHHNIASLLGNSAADAAISKMPPLVQNLLGKRNTEEYEDFEPSQSTNKLAMLADGALSILPFFMKGPKGFVASFVMKNLKKMFFGKK
jgi:hypothetical protein